MAPPRVDGTSPAPLYDYTAPDSDQYVVRSEKTLDEIADKFGLDRDALAEANPQIKDGKLFPLQQINIPNFAGAQQVQPHDTVQPDGPPSAPPGQIGDGVASSAWRANLASGGSAHSGPVQFSDPKGAAGAAAGMTSAGATNATSDTQTRAATIEGLMQKARSAGLGAPEIAIIASMAGLSAAQFGRASTAVHAALNSANPQAAMAAVRPMIIQGSGDMVVVNSTSRLARATGFTTTSFAPGTLEGAEEVTVVAHGSATEIEIGGNLYTPRQLAEALRNSGWEGGTIRLAACETGSANATFAKNLATELENVGADSAVVAAEGPVVVSSRTGLPQVVDEAAGKLLAPGKGWQIFTSEGEGAAKIAGARVAAGEILGFVGFMLEPFELMANFAGTYADVKDALKSRGYVDGFSQGVAAAMKGVPQDSVREQFGREVANDSIGTKVGGGEGVETQYHNKGLVDGYKYFQSLPPEKQKQLRDAAKANGWDLQKDDVTELQRGLEPMVRDMFEKAAEAQRKAEEEKVRKMMGWE